MKGRLRYTHPHPAHTEDKLVGDGKACISDGNKNFLRSALSSKCRLPGSWACGWKAIPARKRWYAAVDDVFHEQDMIIVIIDFKSSVIRTETEDSNFPTP